MNKITHEEIRETFTHYHHLEALAITPLAKSSLIDDMIWVDRNEASYANLGLATRALLDWGLQKLLEKGTMTAATSHETLNIRYRQRLSVSAYAREHDLSERTIQKRRLAGTKRLAKIFQQEIEHSNKVGERHQLTFAVHYEQLTEEARTFVHVLALLEEPILVIPDMPSFPAITGRAYHTLKQNHFVQLDAEQKVAIHPQIKENVVAQVAHEEKQTLSRLIADHHLGNQNAVDAATYLLMADDHQLAAETILSMTENEFYNTLSSVKELLKQFSEQQVKRETWGELRYLSGRVLGLTDSILESIKAYEDALRVGNETVRIKSHYMLAIAHQRRATPEAALAHVNVGIDTLRKRPQETRDTQLLIKLYLHKAMLYTSSLTDYDQAHLALESAETIANEAEHDNSREWFSIRSDIALRWGRYEHQIDNVDEALRRYMQSHVYALEADDVKMRMKIAFYLGVVYSLGRQNYHEALNHFYEGKKLAEQSGSGQEYFLANIHVSIARCLRECEQYAEAVQYLDDVYQYATQTNNNYILAFALLNLIITYLRWGKIKTGITYYKELCDMGTWLKTSYITLYFDEIKQEFPFINDDTLNERQFRGLIHLQKHEKLTRQQYMALNSVTKTVAQEDLGSFVKRGWSERHGRGRSTHYTPYLTVVS